MHAGARSNRHCERESAHGRGTREDRSTIKLGCVRVQTPASCVAGECFIHCAKPLRNLTNRLMHFQGLYTELGTGSFKAFFPNLSSISATGKKQTLDVRVDSQRTWKEKKVGQSCYCQLKKIPRKERNGQLKKKISNSFFFCIGTFVIWLEDQVIASGDATLARKQIYVINRYSEHPQNTRALATKHPHNLCRL